MTKNVCVFCVCVCFFFFFFSFRMVENRPAMRETQLPSLGQEDCLEKRMASYSTILAWVGPWLQRVRHD